LIVRRSRRILVVLDDIGPGDALRSRFALAAVRQAQPEARIILLVSDVAAQIFEHGAEYDHLVVSRLYRAGLRGRWRNRVHKLTEMIRLLGAVGLRHDLVLVLNWGTLALDVLGRLAGGRVVGYENRLRFLLSSRLGPYDVEGDPVEQNLTLLDAAGVPRAELTAMVSNVETAAASEHEGIPHQPYAVLHTGSDWACQQWSPEGWAELGDRLIDEYGITVVFTGLPGEAGYIAGIQARMRRPSTSTAGRTSIAGLQHLLKNASLCVSVDSAPYELAQLMGTPVVVLAGARAARPRMGGARRPTVLNRTPTDLGHRIRVCQRAHSDGNCHDYQCPFSQLPFIDIDQVMSAVGASDMSLKSVTNSAVVGR
jgi:ADP-heptose:LPS heptosyltransferase